MGLITKSPLSSDSDPYDHLTLCELYGECSREHRSCWRHLVARVYRSENKVAWREVRQISKRFRHASTCFSGSFPQRRRSNQNAKQKVNNGIITSEKGKMLDTGIFEHYMEILWRGFSENKQTSCAYLDSLWFSLYRDASRRPKVLTWIKQKHIFSKKYVFVPIVCWGHWSLLIFVHLGESSNSGTRKPCMLLLDSLEKADPRRLEPEIRKFVVDIFKAEGRTEDKKVLYQIPLLVPKVPQQLNDEECGNYVLYFIKLFMEAAPENFSISDGYPYFMRQDWFDPQSLASFCDKLEKGLPKTVPMAVANSSVPLPKTRPLRRRGHVNYVELDDW